MSSGDPPSPNRRVRAKPSLPDAAAPLVRGEVPASAANRPVPSKVDTSVAGDPKNSTQPASQVGPAPKLETLGRYTILGELGRGGMGLVYLAEDTVLKRKVALKIPHFEPHKQEQMRDRFIREAQLAAQLTHRNICQVYDVGVIDDQLVMAMEYIDGRDLTAFTKPDKLLNARSAVALIKKIAQAIDVAHKKGLIHRDLKPSNIMLAPSDTTNKMIEPKVMDFGLAKSLDSTGKQLTHSGMIVGTPCYMSKEQWSGKDGDLGPAADVFSLGVILYELLTGLLPYEEDKGEPATAWFVKLVTKEQIRPSVRKPGLDADLEAIVMKSIAKEVADRYATMADFAAALDGWLKGKLTTTSSTGSATTPAMQSLLDIPFDFGQIAAAHSESPITRSLPSRKPSGLSPTWLIWAGGAVTLMFGIIATFIFNKGPALHFETPDTPASLATRDITTTKTTADTLSSAPLSANNAPNNFQQEKISTSGSMLQRLPADDWTDLLPAVNTPVHAIQGMWRREGDGLVCVGGGTTLVPAVAVGNYQIRLVFTPVDGTDITCRFPIGEGLSAGILLGGWGGGISCVVEVDGGINHHVRHSVPDNGVRQELLISVQHSGDDCWIRSTLNGKDLITYTGARSRLRPSWGFPLMFGIGLYRPTVKFHEFNVKMDEGGTGYLLPEDDWQSPLSDIRDQPSSEIENQCVEWNGKKYLFSEEPLLLPDVQRLARQVRGRVVTVSSKEEEDFILKQGGGRRIWMSGWCGADRKWRDERHRPLRYQGKWAFLLGRVQPDNFNGNQYRLIMETKDGIGWDDVDPSENGIHACIEWGEEYPGAHDNISLSSLDGMSVGDSREIKLPSGVTLKQLWCPPGTFTMGTPGATDDESPVEVTLTQGFWAAATETTQEQWASVMGTRSKPWSGQTSMKEGPYFPANYISHGVNMDGTIEPDSATAFCRNLTEIEQKAGRLPAGWKYALPTEAQWEYMCRAGTKTAYSFGDSDASLGEYAWIRNNTSDVGEPYAHTVGMKKANPWGFFDLHGNVCEWCRDGYVERLSGGRDPFAPPIGNVNRVHRGGCWKHRVLRCRSAYRLDDIPSYRFNLGFRVTLVADTSSELSTISVPDETAMSSFPAGERRVFTFQSIPFRWCPAATFARGEGGTGPEATLTHGFWMGETEVTMEQWKTLMQSAPWVTAKREAIDEPNNPAVWISYADVIAYCEKMTREERAAGRLPEGWKYTLPTGAQWEYACRAGTSTRFSFGNDGSQLREYGWYSKNAKDEGEWYGHAVAQKKPNPWGLYDMHGNVWEWCLDWHHDTLPGGQDPVDSVSGNDRVFWGGGWYYEDWSCTSFSRIGYPPYAANPHVGFRLAIVKE